MRWLATPALLLLSCLTANAAVAADAGDEAERGIVARYLLMNTHGDAVTNKDFLGRFQLIAFGYTYCPDICPTTLAEMSLVMKRLGALADHLQPIFISVDPARDTPEALDRYTTFFHPRLIGLTGKPDLIRRAADNFKVRYEMHSDPGGDPDRYTVDHTAGMYLLTPDGEFDTKFAYATPVSEITEKLRASIEHALSLRNRD